MSALAQVIQKFSPQLFKHYGSSLLPSHFRAMEDMAVCRTIMGPAMLAECSNCKKLAIIPHSCGNRSCPNCQHFECERWIERQSQRMVHTNYFLVTFTLPEQLKRVAWEHQRVFYGAMIDSAWETLKQFFKKKEGKKNKKNEIHGEPGAISVLHTHARDLAYHPHVHMIVPGAALDEKNCLWRQLPFTAKYLFPHKALAAVFRGKLLSKLKKFGLDFPKELPPQWVVDCKCVGDGQKALHYLGNYLYRGVISDKNITAITNTTVTYQWRDAKSRKMISRTIPGEQFLSLVLRHVLPKGLRRTRNHGFLHPNKKKLINLLKLLVFKPVRAPPEPIKRPVLTCSCCGSPLIILFRRI